MFVTRRKPCLALGAVVVASVGWAAPSTAASSHEAEVAAPTVATKSATPWSPWKKLPKSKPFTVSGCGTKLTFSDPLLKAEYRTRTDRDSNFHEQIRGTLHQRVNPKQGHTVVLDVSGPTRFTFYQNDDLYYQATGLNSFFSGPKVYRNSTPTKIPRLFVSTGSFSVFLDGNDTRKGGDDQVTFLDQPTRYWNLCSIVKSGVVPRPFRV